MLEIFTKQNVEDNDKRVRCSTFAAHHTLPDSYTHALGTSMYFVSIRIDRFYYQHARVSLLPSSLGLETPYDLGTVPLILALLLFYREFRFASHRTMRDTDCSGIAALLPII